MKRLCRSSTGVAPSRVTVSFVHYYNCAAAPARGRFFGLSEISARRGDSNNGVWPQKFQLPLFSTSCGQTPLGGTRPFELQPREALSAQAVPT